MSWLRHLDIIIIILLFAVDRSCHPPHHEDRGDQRRGLGRLHDSLVFTVELISIPLYFGDER